MMLTSSLPLAMATAMQGELDQNGHKAGWEDMTPLQLVARARQELGELERALKRVDQVGLVWSEAADVANFVAMAAAVHEGRAIEAQRAIDEGTT